MKAKTIYIAGPISDGERLPRSLWKTNIVRACKLGSKVIELGHNPIIPHLYYFMEELSHTHFDYEDWLRVDFGFIESSDAVLRMDGASKGADREVEFAKLIGRQVFRGLDEIPRV